MCCREVLEAALWQVIANGKAPGVDGVRVEDLKSDGEQLERWLARLEAIREETTRSTLWKNPEEVFIRVNRRVRGWIGYFHYANSAHRFATMERHVQNRLRRWLWNKHARTKVQYDKHYSNERLHEHYRLIRFPLHKWRSA
jgi:hypothetical protein